MGIVGGKRNVNVGGGVGAGLNGLDGLSGHEDDGSAGLGLGEEQQLVGDMHIEDGIASVSGAGSA